MAREVSETFERGECKVVGGEGEVTDHVRQMLIRRSQLHPVMKAAAAGGKRMAT